MPPPTGPASALVIARVRAALRTHRLLPPSHRVLLAFSAGQDSLALAEALAHLRRPSRWPALALAYCDHAWPLDAGLLPHVSAHAARLALPLHVVPAPDPAPARTEAAARAWRYAALAALARAHAFDAVVTAHTQTDLAETVLFNLAHAAGADGLSALRWQRPLAPGVALVRPMLAVSRRHTAALCEERALDVWDDPYNHDPAFARNRIRARVLPALRDALHPNVEHALARSAHLLREDADHLQREADALFAAVVSRTDGGHVRIDRALLADASLALQRRVVRRVLRDCIGIKHRRPLFPHIEAVCALVDDQVGKAAPSLVSGTHARVVCDRWIEISQQQQPAKAHP